jgi:archaeal cell division control protein 6
MEIEEYLHEKAKRLEKASRFIKDYRVFDFNYIPPQPLMREEVKPVADAILRYHRTGIPNNLLIVGSRGSGKTLLVRYLAQRLKSGLRFLYVNCRHHNTSFKMLAEILAVKPRGYGLNELWDHFCKQMPGPTVLILDEVDLISDKDRTKDILYLLSRSERNDMVILLSNNPRFHQQLDSSIRSTLQPEIIHFRDYNVDQVLAILKQRAVLGLRQSSRAVLAGLAGLTVRNANSDIRVGIKTLYLCTVEPGLELEDNFERARRDIVTDLIRGVSDKNLLILRAAAETAEGQVKLVYENYRRLSAAVSEAPFSYVHFYSNLSYLQSIGLIVLVATKIRKTYTNSIQILFHRQVLDDIFKSRFG